ncbi:sensor histidine kinase [Actinomadura rubrisoli]|uniref:histidine kinase n=1 Tax=Actinomadura rubrisoli TaxID=2530368 RepID=A0A4V2YZR7_9ACTN|nr:HAMP domain-containing sensor histidine kinase [Actinomadura rubrisoli]TDD98187.1 HAMP domain-containing histidine kinase [Actinomadura rubrisoli]
MRPRARGRARGREVSLRRHLLVWIVGLTVLAVVATAVPLTLTLQRLYRAEALTTLNRDARALQTTTLDPRGGDRAKLPGVHAPSSTVGLYGPDGHRFLGDGPDSSPAAARCRDGVLHDSREDGQLTATAPLVHGNGAATVVRVGVPYSTIRHRTERAWAVIGLGDLALLTLAAATACRLSDRATRPIEQLAGAVHRLGAGERPPDPEGWDLREARLTGRALDEAARRLDEVLARERSFSTDVAHQLRTPLTRLLLGLEVGLRTEGDARAAIRAALDRGRSLIDTVEQMLQLARDDHNRSRVDVADLLQRVRRARLADATAAGRDLLVAARRPLPPVIASPAALTQILDVLIDNALAHGTGTITVSAYRAGSGLAVDVMDEGSRPDLDEDVFRRRPAPDALAVPAAERVPRHRIGLPLARSLARVEGGRLYLSRTTPVVFTLLLPVGATAARAEQADLRGPPSRTGQGP